MVLTCLKNFLRDTSGASAIEYSLIGILIAVAIMVGVSNTGNETSSLYDCTVAALDGAECGGGNSG